MLRYGVHPSGVSSPGWGGRGELEAGTKARHLFGYAVTARALVSQSERLSHSTGRVAIDVEGAGSGGAWAALGAYLTKTVRFSPSSG